MTLLRTMLFKGWEEILKFHTFKLDALILDLKDFVHLLLK